MCKQRVCHIKDSALHCINLQKRWITRPELSCVWFLTWQLLCCGSLWTVTIPLGAFSVLTPPVKRLMTPPQGTIHPPVNRLVTPPQGTIHSPVNRLVTHPRLKTSETPRIFQTEYGLMISLSSLRAPWFLQFCFMRRTTFLWKYFPILDQVYARVGAPRAPGARVGAPGMSCIVVIKIEDNMWQRLGVNLTCIQTI